MNAIFEKSNLSARGKVEAPPSKSIAHRCLICAFLAGGKSVIKNIDLSNDIRATVECIKELGSKVQIDGNTVTVTNDKNLANVAGKLNENVQLNCFESGSTLRFFIPIAMHFVKKAEFSGSNLLLHRPLSVYENLCIEHGFSFENDGSKISIEKLESGTNLKSGLFTVPGDLSSQFVTGLLFVLPLLDGNSTIKLIPPVESRSYIDLTLQSLADFGIKAEWQNENTLFVPGKQVYNNRVIKVEGDYSNAAFLDVFNFIGGNIEVTELNPKSLQGDKVYEKMFRKISDEDSSSENCILDISDCPDLGPILFALAACKNGATFTGTKRLRYKESDRGKIMCDILSKFGVKTEMTKDKIIIFKSNLKKPDEVLDGHNDHRIVMTESTLLSVTGGEVSGIEAVKKSFPKYFDEIKKLGIKVLSELN